MTRIDKIVKEIEPADQNVIEEARKRTAQLDMPLRALRELHIIGEPLCGVTGSLHPAIDKKAILVMASDHGIARSGTSAHPQSVSGEMVKTFLRGGAGINVLSRQIGAHVIVVDNGYHSRYF